MKQFLARVALYASLLFSGLLMAFSVPSHAGELRRVVSDYAVTPESGLGVIRAFFYGPNAVIEFETPPSSFSAVDAEGKQVEFESEGRYIRLIGRPSVFTAMFSGKAATFRTYTEAARIPKPTVDELAKFDNFYAEKGFEQASNVVTPESPRPQIVVASANPTPPSAQISNAITTSSKTSTVPNGRDVAEPSLQKAIYPTTQIAKSAPVADKPPVPAAQSLSIGESIDQESQWFVQLKDQTLQGTLRRWATSAGWQLSWESPMDIPVTVTAVFDGTFKSAVSQFFESLAGGDAPLKGCLYKNYVLRVVPKAVRCDLRTQ